MGALDEAIRRANSGGGLDWLVDRQKADVSDIMGRWVVLENVHIGPSQYYQGKVNVILTVADRPGYFFRVNSDVVVKKLASVEAGLKDEGLPWSGVAVLMSRKQGAQNRYYDLEICHACELPVGTIRPFPHPARPGSQSGQPGQSVQTGRTGQSAQAGQSLQRSQGSQAGHPVQRIPQQAAQGGRRCPF